jgi:hypothetical protein
MRDSYSGGLFRSACGGHVATSFLGSSFSLGRRSERPSSGSFGSPAANASMVLPPDAYPLFYGLEPLTKSKRVFPLELRAKTVLVC